MTFGADLGIFLVCIGAGVIGALAVAGAVALAGACTAGPGHDLPEVPA